MALAFSLFGNIGLKTQDLETGARRVKAELAQVQVHVKQTEQHFGGVSSAMTLTAGKFLAIAAGAEGLRRGLAGVVTAGQQAQSLRMTFEAIEGSAAKATETLGFLRSTADRLGVNFVTLAQQFKGFEAATKGTIIEGERARTLFLETVSGAKALGLNAEDLTLVLRGLQQSLANFDAENFKHQVGDVMPGTMNILGRAIGKTQQQLITMMKAGELGLPDLVKWGHQLQAELGSKLGTQTQSSAAQVERLTNAITEFKTAVAETGVLTLFGTVVQFLAGQVRAFTAAVQGLKEYVGGAEYKPFQARVKAAALPPVASPAAPPADLRAQIATISSTYGVDPLLIQAIIQQESRFNPRAVSRAGAMGLMQLMPATAAQQGVTAPFDPTQNLTGGISYFAEQFQAAQGNIPLALARYNAGPGAVQKYGGIPPFKETQQYIAAVQAEYARLQQTAGQAAPVLAAVAEQGESLDLLRKQLEQKFLAAEQLLATTFGTPTEAGHGGIAGRLQTGGLLDVRTDVIKETLAQVQKLTEDIARQATAGGITGALAPGDQAFAQLAILRETLQRLSADTVEAAKHQDTLNQQADQVVRGLQEEADQLGMTTMEMTTYRLEKLRQSASVQSFAEDLQHQIEAYREEQEALQLTGELQSRKQEEIEQIMQGLALQRDAYGKTTEEILRQRLAFLGAGEATLKHADAMNTLIHQQGIATRVGDFLTQSLIDMALSGETSFKRLGEAFTRMILEMTIEASGMKRLLNDVLLKGVQALGRLFSPSAAVSEGGPAAIAGLSEATVIETGLAAGGPMMPNRFYTVGEQGPETVWSGSSGGQVFPHAQAPMQPIVINVYGVQDVQGFQRSEGEIGNRIWTTLQRQQRNA